MADYCTLAEVYPLIAQIGTLRDASTGVTATVPSDTQADAICTQITAEINGHLRAKGYVVPVTDADATTFLKTVAMNGAAYRILKSARADLPDIGDDLREDYKTGLALIDDGGLAADMTTDSSETSVAYDFTRTYDVLGSALNADTNVEPF